MKRIASLIVFCCIQTLIGGLLSVNIEAQQKSSNNQKELRKNRQQMNTNQEQTTPPVRTPEELAYFQNAIEQAMARGIVRVTVGVRDFQAQEELLRQLTPFQVRLIEKFTVVPYVALEVNVAALIYMRDSELVLNVRADRLVRLASNASRTPEELAHFQTLINRAAASNSIRVIVGIRTSFIPEGQLTPAQRQAQRAAIRQTQDNLLAQLATFQVTLITKFEIVPYIALVVDAAVLEYMKNSPLVANIQQDRLVKPVLEQSVPLVGAPNAWSRGFSGAGQAIAVLDTGVDKYHVFLRNKVISEGCYSTNDPNQNLASLCPGGATESTAPNSGLNCLPSILGCEHGTHIAGIAAGSYPDANRFGVARDAQVIAIKIFSRDTINNEVSGTIIDMNRGLQRVQALSGTYNIAAVNLSIEAGTYTTQCDNVEPITRDLINTLYSYGIATIVASGNEGLTNAIGFPACISTAVSVGSTQDGSNGTIVDALSPFTNRAPFLDLLAPGEWIFSSVPGGTTATQIPGCINFSASFADCRGTSQAAPHVAGAFAILKQRVNDAPHNQIWADRFLRVLQGTGRPIVGVNARRIQIDAALLALVPPVFDYDGDDRTDVSVFRPGNGTWYLQQSQNGFSAVQFGQSTDVIVPGDYDGDGRTDVAVFRPSNNAWYIQRSRDGFYTFQFGQNGDKVAPGDYDGDGRIEIAVLRPSTGYVYSKYRTKVT